VLDPFRKQALERLSSPEELDRVVRVSRPGTWIALAGLLLVVTAVVLWATLTSITTTVSGLGYVLPEGGLIEASAARPGIVERLDVQPGQRVRPGDVVAKLQLPDGDEFGVVAQTGGRVGEVVRATGDFVPQGGEVAILVPDRRLVVEAFLPVADAKQARVGDRVWVAPTTAAASEFGFARGRVARLDDIPIPSVGIDSLLENPARVSRVEELGPVIHLVIELLPADTPSGLSWTASRGPSEPVTLGTRADVKVVTGQRAPIDYVVG
jgi:multidrug resistance efflux pump